MPISKIKISSITADASSVNLNIDANTLYLDAANNYVGIGKTNPSQALDVNGTIRVGSTSDWIYANNYGLISSSAPMKFSSNADWNWVRHTAGTTAMALAQNGGLTVDHPNSGAYLMLNNSDAAIGGGESIQIQLNYTTTSNSTSWSQVSRYAGNQYQFISAYNGGAGYTRLSLDRTGNLTLGDESTVAISGMSRYLSVRSTGSEEAVALELVGNRATANTPSGRISLVNNTSEIGRIEGRYQSGSTGSMHFSVSGTEVMSLARDGVLHLGTSGSMTPLGEWVSGGVNLLRDGDFSTRTPGKIWQSYAFGFSSAGGSMRNDATDSQRTTVGYGYNGGGLYQAVNVVPGATYTLAGKLRVGPANNTGDGSIPYLTVGSVTSGGNAYRDLVDQAFYVDNYDVAPNAYRYINCKVTFTAPTSSNAQTVVIYVGFRSASNTHTVFATDMGLYKGAVVPEFTALSQDMTSNEKSIEGMLNVGVLRTGQASNYVTGGTAEGRTLLGVFQWGAQDPGNTYLHMKTNCKASTSYYGMMTWRFWGYRYDSADTIYTFFSGHNWSNSIYSSEILNLGGYAFGANQYVSTDGYWVLVGNVGGSGSRYISFNVDLHVGGMYAYNAAMVDRYTYHTIVNTASSSSLSGVY